MLTRYLWSRYLCFKPRYRASAARKRGRFFHTVRKGVCKKFHNHERSASWPSLVLLDDPGRRMYPKDDHVGNISMSQLPHTPWEGGDMSLGSGSVSALSSSYFPNILSHHQRAAPPQANFGAEVLLELSDSVRESLAKQGHFGPDADVMSFFMELALLEEASGTPTLDFETIKLARLDKLVADLIQCGEMPFALAPRFIHDAVTAKKLEMMWRARFKFDYLMIDEIRTNDLTTRWRLKEGLLADSGPAAPEPAAASGQRLIDGSKRTSQSKSEGWWLNLACAHLDGVVGTDHDMTSRGDDGTVVLPLLTGRELNAGHNRVKYLSEGTLADMHPGLLSHTGNQLRVLRGYQLRSHFAPTIGIRDDGLWKLLRYNERRNRTTGGYLLELILEKVPGQPAMSELMKIPRPSHLDDWDLYKKAEVQIALEKEYRNHRSRGKEDWMPLDKP